jgi:hypothetical protein
MDGEAVFLSLTGCVAGMHWVLLLMGHHHVGGMAGAGILSRHRAASCSPSELGAFWLLSGTQDGNAQSDRALHHEVTHVQLSGAASSL